jgi:L-rhamnose mutarotase
MEDQMVPQGAMQRVCFCLKVKPHLLAEYKLRHQAVWPEMLQAADEQMRPLPEVFHLP